jgi:hypothetical protein
MVSGQRIKTNCGGRAQKSERTRHVIRRLTPAPKTQRLLNTDFVFQPGGCLSLASNALSLALVIVRHHPTVFQTRVGPNIVSRVYNDHERVGEVEPMSEILRK